MTKLPDTNPKTQFGVQKPSLGLIPKVALEAAAAAYQLGADKYDPWNWREHSVSAMVYVNAMLRHIQAWKEVEDNDPDTLKSHLGNVMACCGILLDAQAHGCLIDDRPRYPTPTYADIMKQQIEQGTRTYEQALEFLMEHGMLLETAERLLNE